MKTNVNDMFRMLRFGVAASCQQDVYPATEVKPASRNDVPQTPWPANLFIPPTSSYALQPTPALKVGTTPARTPARTDAAPLIAEVSYLPPPPSLPFLTRTEFCVFLAGHGPVYILWQTLQQYRTWLPLSNTPCASAQPSQDSLTVVSPHM